MNIDVDIKTKHYGAQVVLRDVAFEVHTGDVVAIIGPSGSGKSTLLRCLNRLEEQYEGTIRYNGEIPPFTTKATKLLRRRISMVFQSFNLFPHISALQNVALPTKLAYGVSKQEAQSVAVEFLTKVGLADKLHSRPAELSGGQQQRVAIARALAMRPEVILFDEPTSALDPELVGEVQQVMVQLAQEGTTMVVVTHSMGFARAIASRIIMMSEGTIVEQGTPAEVLDDSRVERTRAFLGMLKDADE